MGQVISMNEMISKDFNSFLERNREEIYAMTPKGNVISSDDEWNNETEWDDLFQELKTKEN